ncbi:HzsA-related protein [Haliea sp.]
MVYTRVPRTRGPAVATLRDGSEFQLDSPDVWDALPDTRRVFSGFNAPGQLVLRHPDGSEQILFDCFELAQPCVPLDAAVSLDGNRVLFSVYYGEKLGNGWWDGATLPNRVLSRASHARLHVVDLETGLVTPLAHQAGVFDVSPAWLPDGRIMFASSRQPFREPRLHWITPNNRPHTQLYIADADGRKAVNVTPHEVSSAMHPYLLDSGRVAYGSHWLSHNLAYSSTNGSINWPGTLDNFWVVMDMDARGGDMTALLGAHRTSLQASTGRTKTMKALHFLGQRQNGDICVANYYRANNLGLGDVFCWPPEPVGVEGALPAFLPRGIYNVADWSKSNDEASFTENGEFLGKIGYPEGMEGDQLLLTVGRGYCTQVSGSVQSFQRAVADQPDKRACDVGLYHTSVLPSKNMQDLVKVVDHPDWHEFGARVVRARNVENPAPKMTHDSTCQIASSDALTGETKPRRPYDFNNNYATAANNGGEIDGLPATELAAIRFWKVIPNPVGKAQFKNSIGNRLVLLGDAPLLTDGSFKAQLPCNVPFVMAGVDAEGRVIKRDQVPQSLRPGEKRVCRGCHQHSSPGRAYDASMAFAAKPVRLMDARQVPTYEESIKPIFERRCLSCHVDDVPLMDYDKLVWDFFQESVLPERRVQVRETTDPRRRYGLQRPYTSKYVNNMFARESLLYWKAANRRLDGRTDATFADDIDLGPDHPVSITPQELQSLAEWLDSGAPR